MDKVKLAGQLNGIIERLKKHDPEKLNEIMASLVKSHGADCPCEACKSKVKNSKEIIKEELTKEFNPKFQKGCTSKEEAKEMIKKELKEEFKPKFIK